MANGSENTVDELNEHPRGSSGENRAAMPNGYLIGLLAESHVHVGVGQSGGVIDLPVAREHVTEHPVIPSSGIKGAMRDKARSYWPSNNDRDSSVVCELFGPETTGGDEDAAGAVLFGDGKLLCLPVRSAGKPYRWVTCPHILNRLQRDIQRLGGETQAWTIPEPKQSEVFLPEEEPQPGKILRRVRLEEFSLATVGSKKTHDMGTQVFKLVPEGLFEERDFLDTFCMVSDDVFQYLAQFSLPVRTRNKLEKFTKRVVDNALWNEEYLPPDSLCYTSWVNRFGAIAPSAQERSLENPIETLALTLTDNPYVVVGGKETIGCGWMNTQTVVPDTFSREE